ncbi:hypothetical protein NN561_003258 [Cricetulus griseus]
MTVTLLNTDFVSCKQLGCSEQNASRPHRLAAVKRELKVQEMRLQDAARRRFLKLQQDQREMELRRLEDEIERKIQMRDQEIAATAEDLEIRHLELESQKRLYEKDLTGNQDSVAKEIRKDADAHRQKVALEEHMFRNLLETSQMEGRRTQRVSEDNLAKAEQACLNADWKLQALHKQKNDDLQRSESYQEVATLLRKNRKKEMQVLNAMVEEQAKKWKEAEERESHLQSEKRASACADAYRKCFLKQETSAALEHDGQPLSEEVPRLQREHMSSSCLPQTSQLNDISKMDPTAQRSQLGRWGGSHLTRPHVTCCATRGGLAQVAQAPGVLAPGPGSPPVLAQHRSARLAHRGSHSARHPTLPSMECPRPQRSPVDNGRVRTSSRSSHLRTSACPSAHRRTQRVSSCVVPAGRAWEAEAVVNRVCTESCTPLICRDTHQAPTVFPASFLMLASQGHSAWSRCAEGAPGRVCKHERPCARPALRPTPTPPQSPRAAATRSPGALSGPAPQRLQTPALAPEALQPPPHPTPPPALD